MEGDLMRLFSDRFLVLVLFCAVALTCFQTKGYGSEVSTLPFVFSSARPLSLHLKEHDADVILHSLPTYKQCHFLSRNWTASDTALRLAQEEGSRAVSLLSLIVAGQVITSLVPKGTTAVTFGARIVMDYLLSSSMKDFGFRAGSNLVSSVIPGSPDALWHQSLAFFLGHSALLGHYWPEIYRQLQSKHEGARRIRFMSPSLARLIKLDLLISEGDEDTSAQLTIGINHSVSLPTLETGLTGEWIALVSACRHHDVTSIHLWPGPNGLIVQLWHDSRALSETRLTIASESTEPQRWLTDWLTQKSWPETPLKPVINPLSTPLLSAITALIVGGEKEAVVSVKPLPGLVSPMGRLAMFSTGASGYLLVDRNETADIDLPELWLNTDQPFGETMNESLSQLERQQIPGHWRGIPGLGIEIIRSYVTRSLLHAGLNWYQNQNKPKIVTVDKKITAENIAKGIVARSPHLTDEQKLTLEKELNEFTSGRGYSLTEEMIANLKLYMLDQLDCTETAIGFTLWMQKICKK